MEDTARFCTECGHGLAMDDKFCSACGHHVIAVEVVDEPDDDPQEENDATPDSEATTPPRRRMPAVIAAVAALGLILAGGAWWGLSQRSEAKDQYQAASPVLMSSLENMSTANSTEMVNEVAGSVQGQLDTIDATLDSDPGAKGADRLSTMRDAFAVIAGLQAYKETDTDIWTDNRDQFMSSLDTLTTYGADTQNAASEGEDVVRTLDSLTSRIDKAMTRYRAKLAKARASARQERSEVRSYESQMRSLIGQYSALRRETTEYIDYMYDANLYMYEVDEYFKQAATDRRTIANQMASLRPPAQMRGAHSRIVTLVGDGADAVDSAVSGLDDCYDGESSMSCYWEADSQWEQFQSESERITGSYDAALDTWGAEMAAARKAAKGADLPDRPDL